MIAASRGYRCVVVMPEGYGQVKARLMAGFGAEVVRTPAAGRMSGAIERARAIAAETSGAFLPNQFSNPLNPKAHFETTGPEIARVLGDAIDAWVAGVGTTGTFVGVARYLSDRVPGLLRVAVEPQGSILGGGALGDHKVEGVGLSFLPEILDRGVIDEVATIPDAEAFDACRRLAREEGLLAGGSSGPRRGGGAARGEATGTRQDRRHALPGWCGAISGQGILEISGAKHGLFHRLHSRGQRAGPGDGRRRGPDLPDLDVRPGSARQAQRLRVRADAEPDAARARGKHGRARRRHRRAGFRIGHGGDHGRSRHSSRPAITSSAPT